MRAWVGLLPPLLLLAAIVQAEVLPQGPATVRAESAAFLMSGQSGGELALAVLPVPEPKAEGLALFLELEGRSLRAAAQGSPFFLDLFVYAVGERNRVFAHYNQRLEVRRDSGVLARDGLALRVGLALPPGPCQLRVLARVGDTAFGLRSLPFTQPEPKEAVLLPPLVARPDGRGEGISLGRAVNLPVWPSARPLVVPGTEVDVAVGGSELPSGVPKARFQASGTVVSERALDDVEEEGDARLGRLSLKDLEPGIYSLSLQLGSLKSAAVEIFAAPPENAGATLWMDLLASAQAEAQGPARPAPPTGGERLRRSELGTAYLDVLHRLATGDAEAARQQLLDYEERAVFGPRPPGEERLAKAQDEVLRGLAEATPEALLPVLWLHATSAEQHLRRNRYRLAVLSAHRLDTVFDAVAALDTEERRHLADLFAVLAASHRRRSDLVRAQELFQRALALDEGHTSSLLALAGLAEREEDPDRAVEFLTRLLESRPEHTEALLRQALNRQRQGQSLTARRQLRELRSQDPPWVAVLACQELAHLERNHGRAGTAVVVLDKCLERFPQHAGLQLQLLALLDRSGDPRSAQLLASLDRAAPVTAQNERVRYNRWPEDDVRQGLEATAEVSRERLTLLASALQSLRVTGL